MNKKNRSETTQVNTKNKTTNNVKYPVSRNLKLLHNASIFRPVKRGRRRVGVKYNFESQTTKVAIRMEEELDIADQDLMICLFAIARSKEFKVLKLQDAAWKDSKGNKQSVQESMGIELGSFTLGSIPSEELRSIQIEITKYELLKELGRKISGQAYVRLLKSLSRLSSTVYHHQGEKWKGSFSMLSFIEYVETENLLITINPIASYAIRKDDQGYVLQHRGERGQLKSDEARSLHSILCSMVDPNKTKNVSINELVDRVWGTSEDGWARLTPAELAERYGHITFSELKRKVEGDSTFSNSVRKIGEEYEALSSPTTPGTSRKRKASIKKVLEEEIGNLDSWSISFSGRGDRAKAHITRSRATRSSTY